jgi:DMATS type aromatic prenyltransferase
MENLVTPILSVTKSPYDIVTQEHEFPNEDQKFWWRATASSLHQLLKSCGYSEEEQLVHLRWYHRFILPALGPRPISGEKAAFQPCPVYDGSACELSINWKELHPARVVRFTIEAVGYQAGTMEDPYNQEATKELFNKLERENPDIDLKQFTVFANELFLPSTTAESLLPNVPAGTPYSQVWVAFDLVQERFMPKVYFMPILKWIHSGIPTKTLVFDAVRKCNNAHGTFDSSIALLDQYLESFPLGYSPVIEMVAIDCTDSPNSRIKCYLRTGVNTLAKAKQQFTLGGRLSGEVFEAGINALSELWPILFRLQGDHDNIENMEVFPAGSYCGCAVEMKPNQAEPQTKLHIPVRKIAGTDAQLCESLSAWFKVRGDMEFAQGYKRDLKAAL